MSRSTIRDITKRFGDVTAVDHLDLEVRDREFLVLLGPSGCGKSTALRLIAGLEDPTEGTVQIDDRVVTDVEPRDRDLAMVFQSYALYPHMTVRKNIEFPLRSRKVPSEERERLVTEAATVLGLSDLLHRKPAQLSGGQRQRVALARAIVRRPAAFLMDEPLSNLDAQLRIQTRAELTQLRRRLDTTVVYVTHDQVEAMTMGDRIAVLDEGRLQQLAPPQEVYARPANRFVAGFIGSPPMNLLEAPVVRDGDAFAVTVAGGRVPVPAAVGAKLDGALSVVMGVRPEDTSIDPDGPLQATVGVVEELGYERLVVCRVDTDEIVIIRQPVELPAPDAGAGVRIDAAPTDLHWFAADSGERLA